MWSKVKKYIARYDLLDSNQSYIVALSGGADSVALLLLLHEAGYKVHAAHCNFHLRGAESDRDEAFCVDLCSRLGVQLHQVHFETREWAEVHKVSIEMAARELRYRWFGALCKDLGTAGVCVAHHRDDSVETVLMNLVRGTGLRGLTGIQPQNELFGTLVLRPLLGVSRQEIEAFLLERGQQYVTDSTNLETDMLRNKVRLQVLPLLQSLNEAVAENIQRTAENLTEAQGVLDSVIAKLRNDNTLDFKEIGDSGSIEYLSYEWLKSYGFNGDQVRQILAAKTGAIITSATGYEVLKDRGCLVVEEPLAPMKPLVLPEPGNYQLPATACDTPDVIQVQLTAFHDDMEPSKLPTVATLDASAVKFPLTLRRVAEGDSMQPFGMKGRKLISDIMTDRHMNLFEKRRQLVLTDAEGKVLWLVGIRTDERCRIVKGITKEVLNCRIFLHENKIK